MFFLIMLSVVLFLFCLYLFLDNRIINKKLEKIEAELKTLLEQKIQINKEDSISIDNISENTISTTKEEIEPIKKEIKEETNPQPTIPLEKVPYIATNNNQEEEIPEFKDPISPILEEKSPKLEAISKKDDKPKVEKTENSVTPPKKEIETTKNSPSLTEKLVSTETQSIIPNITITDDFDPTDFIKNTHHKKEDDYLIKDKPQASTVDIKEIKPSSSNKKIDKPNAYLEELSTKLTEEIPPQTIELTGYEKLQEEQAVISYQELLSLKEKLKNQDKQDKQFIETLKEIRRLLDSNP